MQQFIKKNKLFLLASTALILVFFATRLVRLDLIPIFTDEAIYLRWSQIMAYDAGLRYMPLTDGKPPLFMWSTAVVMRTLPALDPLLAGRLTAVAAGFLGITGIAFTAYQLSKRKSVALWAAALYLISPFTFFYDRFGLADGLLAAIGVWSLGLGIILFKTLRPDVALILGWVIGLGLLTKTPALFFLAFLPLLLVAFDFQKENLVLRLTKLAGLLFIVAIESQIIFSILRLFPLFSMVSTKNSEFVLSFAEFFKNPFHLFLANIKTLLVWEWGYLTPVIGLLIIIAVCRALFKRNWLQLVVFGYFVIHLLYMAFFNKAIFPRFLLTFTPELLILAAITIDSIKKFPLLIAAAVLVIPVYTDFKLVTDPPRAPIPEGDSNQYINRWPAGYGVKEIRAYLAMVSVNQRVIVGTEGTFGLMPYALQIYQKEYPNVEIKDYWPLQDKIPKEINEAAKKHPTYFIIYQQQTDPVDWRLTPVLTFKQGIGSDTLRLYKVTPQI